MKTILITNDDGYKARGLAALARAMAQFARVIVVAPERQRSAVSHAITLHKPLRLTKANGLSEDNLEVYYSNGTPSDCMMLGFFHLAPDASLALSGINHGPNMGEDVHYSGTVSAAVEGALLGVPAISLSQAIANGASPDFEKSAAAVAKICRKTLEEGLPHRTVLNVNIPPGAQADTACEITTLGSREYKDVINRRQDPRGIDYFWVAGEATRQIGGEDADHRAIERGNISITPLKLDMTDRELAEQLRNWKF